MIKRTLLLFLCVALAECQRQIFIESKFLCDGQNSICMNRNRCNKRNGTETGMCFFNQKVCCDVRSGGRSYESIERYCGSSISAPAKLTTPDSKYFTRDQSCEIHINPSQRSVKITFDEFDFPAANNSTNCNAEYLQVKGDGKIIKLCRNNKNQHIILNLHQGVTLKFQTISKIEDFPEWRITINEIIRQSQVKQNSKNKDVTSRFISEIPNTKWNSKSKDETSDLETYPSGCLQYYRERKGEIKSFNYATKFTYPSNLYYAICIERHPGLCGIKFSEVSFDVGKTNEMGKCPDDYLQIYGTAMPDRYCGSQFAIRPNTEIYGPIILFFFSNDTTGKIVKTYNGFKMEYRLTECVIKLEKTENKTSYSVN